MVEDSVRVVPQNGSEALVKGKSRNRRPQQSGGEVVIAAKR